MNMLSKSFSYHILTILEHFSYDNPIQTYVNILFNNWRYQHENEYMLSGNILQKCNLTLNVLELFRFVQFRKRVGARIKDEVEREYRNLKAECAFWKDLVWKEWESCGLFWDSAFSVWRTRDLFLSRGSCTGFEVVTVDSENTILLFVKHGKKALTLVSLRPLNNTFARRVAWLLKSQDWSQNLEGKVLCQGDQPQLSFHIEVACIL